MAITREDIEFEKHCAYIRGCMATMDLVQEKIDQARNDVEAELLGGLFKTFCDGYTRCEGCKYVNSESDDCFSLYVKEWREEYGKCSSAGCT